MHRWLTAQGVLAVVVLIAAGCASAKQNGNGRDFGTGGGGGGGDDLGDVDQGGGGGGGDGGGGGPDMRSGMCNVVSQTGCAPGEKCTLGTGMTTQCIPDGTLATGSLCGASMTDDCVHANVCITETTTLNECRQTCTADTDCKQPAAGGVGTNTGHCLITLTGAGAKVCTVACQAAPAAGASGCAAGLGCQVYGYMSGGLTLQGTDCAGPGAGVNGSNCATNGNGDCAAGFGCISVTVGATTTSSCRRICRIVGGTPQNGDCVAGAPTCNTTTSSNPAWGFCCPSGGC